ncbi:uncharacterized protein LOC122264423 [Penaeus japonicus]|uniref:uncharacterized protein LOC122264423 n=1 Tax=Penaeus japonicus TaxID=27405 RepID=UPI001C714085|nr:uncharacterized protein LOC122264423 [Penaeus japonicus]
MKSLVMSTVFQVEQMMYWIMRKYVKFLVLGALSSCALLNVALHAGAGMQYYCQEECLNKLLEGPIKSLDLSAIKHIRKYWVDEGSPPGTYAPPFPIENPPWVNMGNWGEAYKFINNYFKGYNTPGTFMEIGAQDGEFMSLTLYLEKELGFRGLLVEPNPNDYEKLRSRGRTAKSINACATPAIGHRADQLWLRDTPSNLPPILKRIQEGSNRLLQYVSSEDRELGKTVPVQCFNTAALAAAALGTTEIDLLTISTHGGEMDILSSIPRSIRIRMIVMAVPLASKEEWDELKAIGKARGLTTVFDKYNLHILIPSGEVKIV